jgi:hypothetical protein
MEPFGPFGRQRGPRCTPSLESTFTINRGGAISEDFVLSNLLLSLIWLWTRISLLTSNHYYR